MIVGYYPSFIQIQLIPIPSYSPEKKKKPPVAVTNPAAATKDNDNDIRISALHPDFITVHRQAKKKKSTRKNKNKNTLAPENINHPSCSGGPRFEIATHPYSIAYRTSTPTIHYLGPAVPPTSTTLYPSSQSAYSTAPTPWGH